MEDNFEFVDCNFPPDPAPVEYVNGKVVCDLTSYDPPPELPSNILHCEDLNVLKVFTDHLQSIPHGIGNLKHLEQLVLCHSDNHSHDNPSRLPITLKNLTQLELLDLRNNPLSEFPLQITMLLNLRELHVSNCRLSSLPDQIDQLQQLKVLDFSNNMFTNFPVCVTKLHSLEKLYISDGVLKTVCSEIKNLTNLQRLQLTNNQLTSLPDGLFELINLRKLYLNSNQLTSLDDKVGDLTNLEFLVLNRNKLTRIPRTIGNLKGLYYLNLHENMLTSLPESITNLTKMQTIHVENNPLQVPPAHVCNQGIPSINNYFQAMQNTGNIHSKRLKVFLLGKTMAGKTSLVNALLKGEACEISRDDRTFGVGFYHWKPEPDVDELELLLVDCAGQREYQLTHQLFLSEGALFLLAVDLSGYQFDNPDCYHSTVGEWIALVAARIPRARILIVPTHVDKCSCQEDIDLKCENIVTYVEEQLQEMRNEIDKKFKYIQRTEGRSIPESDQRKLTEEFQKKKDNLPVISLEYRKEALDGGAREDLSMSVIPVSNIGCLQGMTKLRKELVRIARNKALFSAVDRQLPESWVMLERTIKDLGNNMEVPCVSIAELLELLEQHDVGVSESELDSCLTYLHAIGELVFFKNIDGLVKKLVLNPYWLVSLLKKVFRHDLVNQLTYNESCRQLGVHSFIFNQHKKELLEFGTMTETLLRCIWADHMRASGDILPELLTMLTHFGLACEIPSSRNDLDHSGDSRAPLRYLMPWFFSSFCPKSIAEIWPKDAYGTQVEVTTGFALLQYLPLGVFERFSVRCHKHEPDDFQHWHGGLYMKFEDVLVRGAVSCAQRCSTLMLTARAPKSKLSNLWRTLLILLKEVQTLLMEWPGMNATCFTVCPECVNMDVKEPFRFVCDWFKPHRLRKRKVACRTKVNGATHQVELSHLFPSDEVLTNYPNPDYHPLSVSDVVLPDEFLDYIADELGTGWPQLARKLGIGTGRVSSIRGDHQGDTHEQAVEMLVTWKRQHGSNAKISVIVDALRDIPFTAIADSIEEKARSM